MDIRISVVIPAFNSRDTIKNTLSSIMKQNLPHEILEIIIVDDGSSDDTAIVAQKHLDKMDIINHIFVQSNKGVSFARNSGLEYAKGEYVFFLDSDDIVKEKCLARLYEKAESTYSDIVYCGFDMVDSCMKPVIPYESIYKYHSGVQEGIAVLEKMIKREIWICSGSALFRRIFLTENRLSYRKGCLFCEDTEFRMKALFHAKRVACVNETLSYYVQYPKSTTHERNFKRLHCIGAAKRIKSYLKERNAKSELIKALETYYIPAQYASAADYFLRNNYRQDIIQKFINSKGFKNGTFPVPFGTNRKTFILWARIMALRYAQWIYVIFIKLRNRRLV